MLEKLFGVYAGLIPLREKVGRDTLWPRPRACPPRVRSDSALAAAPNLARHVSAVSPPALSRHQVEFFSTIAQPTAFILHACWPISLASILASQTRPLQASAPYA